jgi:hypothetical protein
MGAGLDTIRPRTSTALVRALIALAGGGGVIALHNERSWASITFSGSRHEIAMSFCGAAAVAGGERLIAALPDHELKLPGAIVADACVVEVTHLLHPQPQLELRLDILVLDDGD